LNIIGGIDTGTSGKLFVFGENTSDYDFLALEKYRLEQISFVLQEPIFISHLTVKENLQFSLNSRKKEADVSNLEKILELTGLSERVENYPETLSGGEKQRLSIAIALALNHKIFLCDEPTGQLDMENKRNIANLLKEVHRMDPSKIIIIVSHDPLFAEYADRILVIEDGHIKQELSSDKLKSSYGISEESLKQNLNKEHISALLKKVSDELENL